MLVEGGEESNKDGRAKKEIQTKITIENINDTKSWFFAKTSNIDKLLARLIKKKRERTQINQKRKRSLQLTPQKHKGS